MFFIPIVAFCLKFLLFRSLLIWTFACFLKNVNSAFPLLIATVNSSNESLNTVWKALNLSKTASARCEDVVRIKISSTHQQVGSESASLQVVHNKCCSYNCSMKINFLGFLRKKRRKTSLSIVDDQLLPTSKNPR